MRRKCWPGARHRGRPAGDTEIAEALKAADSQHGRLHSGPELFHARLRQADHRLLAGDYKGAVSSYALLLRLDPASLLAWGKLLRWFAFVTTPVMRRRCFRGRVS